MKPPTSYVDMGNMYLQYTKRTWQTYLKTLKVWLTCSLFPSLEQVIPESSCKLNTDLQMLHKTAFSTIHRAGFLLEAGGRNFETQQKVWCCYHDWIQILKLSCHKHKKSFVVEETNMYHMGYLDDPADRWFNGWFFLHLRMVS